MVEMKEAMVMVLVQDSCEDQTERIGSVVSELGCRMD